MRARLRGVSWKVVKSRHVDRKDQWGDIDDPSTTGRRKLRISKVLAESNRYSKKQIEVMVHECLHGLFWDLDETVIRRAGKDIAAVLHKLGARLDLSQLPEE